MEELSLCYLLSPTAPLFLLPRVDSSTEPDPEAEKEHTISLSKLDINEQFHTVSTVSTHGKYRVAKTVYQSEIEKLLLCYLLSSTAPLFLPPRVDSSTEPDPEAEKEHTISLST